MGADRNPIKPVAMIKIENGQMNFAGWVKPVGYWVQFAPPFCERKNFGLYGAGR
jgi:hypothetical protein